MVTLLKLKSTSPKSLNAMDDSVKTLGFCERLFIATITAPATGIIFQLLIFLSSRKCTA